MIKIFGKIRYHWQPELSWSMIYWSLTLTLIFVGLSFLYERTPFSVMILSLFAFSLLLIVIGLRRYFIIEADQLFIASANPLETRKIPIASIEKVSITYLSIQIVCEQFPSGKIYYMRKWPKKYFINALAIHPEFQGEMELLDHMTQQDYFEEYYAPKS